MNDESSSARVLPAAMIATAMNASAVAFCVSGRLGSSAPLMLASGFGVTQFVPRPFPLPQSVRVGAICPYFDERALCRTAAPHTPSVLLLAVLAQLPSWHLAPLLPCRCLSLFFV